MNPLTISLAIVFGLVAYTFAGYWTWRLTTRHMSSPGEADAHAPIGVFWPVIIVFFAGIWLLKGLIYLAKSPEKIWHLVPRLKAWWQRKSQPKQRRGEMERGIPRPSYILAGTIAAEMLKAPEKFGGGAFNWAFEYKGATVKFENPIHSLRRGNTEFIFEHTEDKTLLSNAAAKCHEIAQERAVNQLEYDRQMTATNIIDELFRTEPEPVTKIRKHIPKPGRVSRTNDPFSPVQ